MKALFLGWLLASGLAATAQTSPAPTFTATCQNQGSTSRPAFCETRDLAMPAPTGQPLTIAAGANGSISVQGWDGPDVRIRAVVRAWASTEAEAQARVAAIRIQAAGHELRATIPAEEQQAAVSYEVFVPRRTALALSTQNGSLRLAGLQAAITFSAQNGSVSLTDLGGQVSGKTVNGSLSISLSGRQWQGEGLDVATTNGSIHWQVPTDYSAQLFTGTTNGGLHTTLPQSGPKGSHQVNATLGKGGPAVKAVTTNGSVTLKQG